MAHSIKPRIMYIEYKGNDLTGPARIGRVTFSKTGETLYYRGRSFQSLKGDGFKANYYDVETLDEYWISGLRKEPGIRSTRQTSQLKLTMMFARNIGLRFERIQI
jgi:hypothetical protein